MKNKCLIISLFVVILLLPILTAQSDVVIYNKKTNKLIIEKNFHIELPEINEQISVQKARVNLPIVSGKGKVEINSPGFLQAVDLYQEQGLPWGIERVRAPYVWSFSKGNKIKVAVLDTGINYNHPDLNVAGGVSFIDEDYIDYVGHGTALAGIISALDNDIGVVGVAPEVELYSVKVMDEKGGYLIDVLDGIDWAIANKMDIISMSFGTSNYSEALEYKLTEAYDAGIISVAASGNDGEDVLYPAKYPAVIAVGNTNFSNELSHSNSGATLELTAPGTDIVTTYLDDGYALGSGTSFSVPHVAGIIALILEDNPNLSLNEIRAKLYDDAIDLGTPGRDDYFGYGLVQVELPVVRLDKTEYENNIYINEVELNPFGNPDAGEWVELYNAGPPVNLNGWHLKDKRGERFNISGIIDDFYIFDAFSSRELVNDENITLFNDMDILIDGTGILGDDDQDDDKTWQRVPDGTGDFVFKEQTKEFSNEPVIDFTISPSLNFKTIKPGQESEIIYSVIAVNELNNADFNLNIELVSDSGSIFSNIYFDLNNDSVFEDVEQLDEALNYPITDIGGEQTINLPIIIKVPQGFAPGQSVGKISYIAVGEID